MHAFQPQLLAAWTGGCWTSIPKEAPSGFCVDSRSLPAGFAFVALKTARRDGHDYLRDALEAGASAAIVARADPRVPLAQLVVPEPLAALQSVAKEHRISFGGTVFGVTGSAGKTSTKELLALLLSTDSTEVLSTEANLNNQIGVALTLCRLEPGRHRFAVVEAGISAPGEMGTLAGMIIPDVALVTMVGPAHLAELGGVDGVAREKAVLPRARRAGGFCVFPESCLSFAPFREIPESERVVVARADVLGARSTAPGFIPFSVSHSGNVTVVSMQPGGGAPLELSLSRVTDGMAQNAALAAAAAIRVGVKREDLRERLASWRPSRLRGEWRSSEAQRVYLDCYNANPASMADALAAFDAIAGRDDPRLFVLGCMEELGPDSERYHVELGRSLRLGGSDQLVAIGGLAGAIRQGAIEAGVRPGQIEVSDSIGPLTGTLSSFRGSVFVKGSRRHGLEKAFPVAENAGVPHA